MAAASSSSSATGEFLQFIHSVLLAKNHQKIQSKCLVHEFFFTDIFIDTNHGYKAALLKKNTFWLLPFYVAVAYCCCEKVRRTMRIAVASCFLKYFCSFSAAELNNIEIEDKVCPEEFSYNESDYGESDDEDI